MEEALTGTLLIVAGAGDVQREYSPLIDSLAARLDQPVALSACERIPAHPASSPSPPQPPSPTQGRGGSKTDQLPLSPCGRGGWGVRGHALGGEGRAETGESVAAGIRELLAGGVRRFVVLSLLFAQEEGNREISQAIRWASRRWPFLTFHVAEPLSWQEWTCVLLALARDALANRRTRPEDAALLIAAAGSANPLANADLARLAHLAAEAGDFARTAYAFVDNGRPGVAEALEVQQRLGSRDVVLVPWFLAAGAVARLEGLAERDRGLCLSLAGALVSSSVLGDVLLRHHEAALADESLLAPDWEEVARQIARGTHGPAESASQEEAQLRDLERRIKEMLPPQYEDRYEQVSSRSMGSAGLAFGSDGQVAWDEMWTSFCDLALAGGPAHRGTLLEAVAGDEALAEPQKYQAVVAEIERGIKLVTGLPVVPSKTPGWVGVRCDSEAMAVWLLRAIIVENVMVRREGEVIYLPAGPSFTLQREIKNVVTVVAKTCHYWTAHRTARQATSRLENEP